MNQPNLPSAPMRRQIADYAAWRNEPYDSLPMLCMRSLLKVIAQSRVCLSGPMQLALAGLAYDLRLRRYLNNGRAAGTDQLIRQSAAAAARWITETQERPHFGFRRQAQRRWTGLIVTFFYAMQYHLLGPDPFEPTANHPCECDNSHCQLSATVPEILTMGIRRSRLIIIAGDCPNRLPVNTRLACDYGTFQIFRPAP